jgi:hypothetical protein
MVPYKGRGEPVALKTVFEREPVRRVNREMPQESSGGKEDASVFHDLLFA